MKLKELSRICFKSYLDHLENISADVLFLYLLSSLSEPPIGDWRGKTVRRLFAERKKHLILKRKRVKLSLAA